LGFFTVGAYKSAQVGVAFSSRKATPRGTWLHIATVKMFLGRSSSFHVEVLEQFSSKQKNGQPFGYAQ
jgi:hypothetical protein